MLLKGHHLGPHSSRGTLQEAIHGKLLGNLRKKIHMNLPCLANRLYLKQFRSLRVPLPCLLLAFHNDKAAVQLTFSVNS